MGIRFPKAMLISGIDITWIIKQGDHFRRRFSVEVADKSMALSISFRV